MEALVRSHILALTLALAGCGGGDGGNAAPAGSAAADASAGSPAAAKLAACTVLTDADVGAIIGGSATSIQSDVPGTWADGANTSTCNYSVATPDLVSLSLMQPVSPVDGSADITGTAQSDVTSSGIPATTVEPLDGLGVPAAHYRLLPEVGGTYYVIAQKGSVRLIATAGSDAAAQAMIGKAVQRIP
jgi:hypothetical protein